MGYRLRPWSGKEHQSLYSGLFFVKSSLKGLFRIFSIIGFLFYLSACGLNRSAQFTGNQLPGSKEENLPKEGDALTTETSSQPVVAAVAPELAPNSPTPNLEPPPSSTPNSSGSIPPVRSKGLSSEETPAVPPTPIAGSFLLECLVNQGNKDILFVSVMCRVLKDGIVQLSVGKLPTDWQISSTATSGTWGSIEGINAPTLPGVWNADFPLPVDSYIGRGVRVKHPDKPGWIETTLNAIDSYSPNGFASLASLGRFSIGGTAQILLRGCSDGIKYTEIQGSGVRTFLTVESNSGTIAVSVRGICGGDFKLTKVIPGLLIVKPVGSTSNIFEKSLDNESFSSGPLSLKQGTYEISFETVYNRNIEADPYDNIGFQSLKVIPIEGKLSSSNFEFFKRKP